MHTVQAHKRHLAGGGLERGEAARGDGTAFGQPLGDQGQAEVYLLQRQTQAIFAAAIDAGKGVQAAAPKGEQVGLQQRGGLGLERVAGDHAVVECELGVLALQGQLTRHLEEAKHVQVQLTGRAGDFTLRPVQRDFHAAVRAGGHGQSGTARAVFVGRVNQAKVHHRVAVFACAVDVDQQVGALGQQSVHADEGRAGRASLHRRPAAQLVGDVAV